MNELIKQLRHLQHGCLIFPYNLCLSDSSRIEMEATCMMMMSLIQASTNILHYGLKLRVYRATRVTQYTSDNES